ncbi:MAG: hypothetical protein ABIM99_04940 [Candidatus Dojkabacteria bacterium]
MNSSLNNIETSLTPPVDQDKKKLIAAIILAIVSLLFFVTVAFTYGRSTEKSPAPTFDDVEVTPVSSPGIDVGEPNPSTPSATPVTGLTTYTYAPDHGFNFQYNSSEWDITQEPSSLNSYNPGASQGNGNDLTLTSMSEANNTVSFFFTKAVSSIISGNPIIVCSDQYTILIDQGPIGSDGGDMNKGLIRMVVPGGNSVYAKFYYQDTSEPSKMCIFTSHPIYFKEVVAGGDTGQVPDSNDIYWIVYVSASKDNTQLSEIDEMVKSISFAQ